VKGAFEVNLPMLKAYSGILVEVWMHEEDVDQDLRGGATY
jgi:hypothetical protein